MTGQTPLPFRVLVTAAADAPVASLAREIQDDRLIVTACTTEDEARQSLIAGLPDIGILDGSLPGASLLRVYTELRPERAADQVPILFTSHAMDASSVSGGVPDAYLAADADLEAIRNAVYQSLGIPLPEPIVAGPDPLVSSLMEGLRVGGFDAATYASAASVLRELQDGLPAAAVLDARLPQAELDSVYRSIREQPGGADLPVLFIHDHRCPPGSIVRNGSDMYLGEGASVEEALETLHDRVFARRDPAQEPVVAAAEVDAGSRPGGIASIMARNPLAVRVLRALPIAAMIVIGGFAGVMTVKTFDTRAWPLAHPIEVSAATPPATSAPALVPTAASESPLQALATRAASSSTGSPRVTRATPETPGCALMPAFESLRAQVGEEIVGRCTDQPTTRENGDAQQPTTKGLFALRARENWVAFTDGHRTWVRGPNGIQTRLNTERFPWESASATFDDSAVTAIAAILID
jgi:DNA-binding response OmpR family regulator